MLPFIISGLVAGSVYGLAGVGLVLTYKTSGVFNFAYGAIATICAFSFYTLHIQEGMAWPAAAAIVVLVIGPVIGLLMERLAAQISGAGLATQVTATVGLLLLIQGAIVLHYGLLETRIVPAFLASGQFGVGGAVVQYSELITFLIATVATAALYLYFRFARAGVAMRAVVDNPELLAISGTSVTSVRRYAWVIGTVFAAMCGVLLSPLLPLDSTSLTLLVVQAFGAAAIGGFRSLPLTYLGGLIIGVLAALSSKWFTTGILTGLPTALPFLVLFVVLLVVPGRYLADGIRVRPRVRSAWRAPTPVQIGGGVVVVAALAFVPTFASFHIIDWTVAVASIITFLSLGLLVRISGQVSLCHVAFMAIGATAFSHLAVDENFPWLLALLGAMVIAVPVGALLAIPAVRLGGLYLALATFGFGVLLATMFYTQKIMFGTNGEGLVAPRPAGFQGDHAFYYLVLGIAVLISLIVLAITGTRLGRLMRGIGDSPLALAATGVSSNVTQVVVFCISAALAAFGGALAAMAAGSASAESYPPLLSLTLFALTMIVVGREPWFAIIAALAWYVVPSYITGETTTYWLQVAFGVFAILYAVRPPAEAPAGLRRFLDARFRRGARGGPERSADSDAAAAGLTASRDAVLEARDLKVRFGGLVAVDDVSFDAAAGRITGLIGPNGAGKSTTFGAVSGLVRTASGSVALGGRDLGRRGFTARMRAGLGRTFQQVTLLDSQTVWDNVAMGAEGEVAGASPFSQVIAKRHDSRQIRERTTEALAQTGLLGLAEEPVASLSTGQRRLVEMARVLAGRHDILLLDEPSSGLDHAETAEFGRLLRECVAKRGVGIVLIEHDMELVMGVCDHIYVLDFGRLVFDGSPDEVQRSPVVQAAYLGDTALETDLDEGVPA